MKGYHVKLMARNKDMCPEVSKDIIESYRDMRLSQKEEKIGTGLRLCSQTIGEIDNIVMTRRVVVSHIYTIFVPMIFTESLTDKVKKLLKLLLDNEGWDGALENELAGRARSVLKELVLDRDDVLP